MLNYILKRVLISTFIFTSMAVWADSTKVQPSSVISDEYNQWLKQRFGRQHEELIPVVAVADMFFACNNAREMAQGKLTVKYLLTKVDKNNLAEKLISCLQGESPKSDTGLNFGLTGCFYQQFDHLSPAERDSNMKIVSQAIAKLPREQRQKSFSKCVHDQAIRYLK